MKEYIISYNYGTSPYYYNVGIIASTEAEAISEFLKREAPANMNDYYIAVAIKV